ncbi:MAG: site-specific integrase [Acidobacteriota bacterium]|nr:site-specific integrase [Acidobacteriota bacterium]
MDLVIRNETARCELPRLIPREMTIFTQEEVRLFLDAAKSERLFALFSFLLGTGCRPEEALGLKWTDVDLEKSAVVIRRALVWQRSGGSWAFCEPKTKKSNRTLPLPLSLTQELKRHRIRQHEERLKLGTAWTDINLIFPSQVGTPLTMSRVTRVFKRIKDNAEITKSVRLYDLRHTMATLLLQANVNPKIVSERLGHSTVTQTLDTYTAVLPHLQEQASEHLEDMIFGKTGT